MEVAPAYDGRGEQTALVAAQVGYEILTSWVGRGMAEMEKAYHAVNSANTSDELERSLWLSQSESLMA